MKTTEYCQFRFSNIDLEKFKLKLVDVKNLVGREKKSSSRTTCVRRESNPELGHGKTQCYRYTTNASTAVCALQEYHSFQSARSDLLVQHTSEANLTLNPGLDVLNIYFPALCACNFPSSALTIMVALSATNRLRRWPERHALEA